LERSGKKDDFIGKYKMRLRFLDEYREKSVLKRDWFETLKHTNKLYAIKIKDDKNIRILVQLRRILGHKICYIAACF
jgi:hypothetical protein